MQSYLPLRLVLVTVADVCVLCSSLRRAEQEKKLAQQKKEEEERLRKEEADKKAKEAEEKRKRLEEAEKKRQAMMQVLDWTWRKNCNYGRIIALAWPSKPGHFACPLDSKNEQMYIQCKCVGTAVKSGTDELFWMFQAQKEKQQAAGQGAKGTVKKADSGVSTLITFISFIFHRQRSARKIIAQWNESTLKHTAWFKLRAMIWK